MKKQNFRLFISFATFVALCMQAMIGGLLVGHADAQAGDIVINEISWAGSLDNSNDEWIELYNTTSAAIDLTGWYVEDDGVALAAFESGSVPAHGYFLIEDSEAVTSVAADALMGFSFANTGDSLILKNAAGDVIDSVNAGGGAWYAGDGTSKAAMERVDPLVLIDSADNFTSCLSGNGSTASAGSAILGTPGSQNSVYQGSPDSLTASFGLSNDSPLTGEVLAISVEVSNASDLFAYGFDVLYDPAVLTFASASEAGFLNSDGSATAFNYALEDGAEGKLVIGNARLLSPAAGVSGDGDLFVVTFDVIGAEGDSSDLVFGGASFMADSAGDVLAMFSGTDVTVGSSVSDPVSGLTVSLGNDIYSLALSWEAPESGADSYLIYRVAADDSIVQIGTSSELSFVDSSEIVPGVSYEYQVRAVKNGIQSSAVSATGVETRGLTGDNNRSGRVDGRDVENLARHYGAAFGANDYEVLVDTTYDGLIDGSDLIDIGANFGMTI
jgi:hypothetical protein